MKYGVDHKVEPKEYAKRQSKSVRANNPVKYLLNQARYRAKQKGHEFTVKFEDLVVPEFCPVFGIKLGFNPGKRIDSSYSIDRLDNSIGYTKENTRIISWKANQYKGNMTIAEVESLLKYMKGI